MPSPSFEGSCVCACLCVCTWGYVCEHTCKCACMPVSVCVCVHVHVQRDKDGVEGEITERISHSWAPQDSVLGPLHGSFCVSLNNFIHIHGFNQSLFTWQWVANVYCQSRRVFWNLNIISRHTLHLFGVSDEQSTRNLLPLFPHLCSLFLPQGT